MCSLSSHTTQTFTNILLSTISLLPPSKPPLPFLLPSTTSCDIVWLHRHHHWNPLFFLFKNHLFILLIGEIWKTPIITFSLITLPLWAPYWETKLIILFLTVFSRKPLCLFRDWSTFTGDHRARVHLRRVGARLSRTGKLIRGHLITCLLLGELFGNKLRWRRRRYTLTPPWIKECSKDLVFIDTVCWKKGCLSKSPLEFWW